MSRACSHALSLATLIGGVGDGLSTGLVPQTSLGMDRSLTVFVSEMGKPNHSERKSLATQQNTMKLTKRSLVRIC